MTGVQTCALPISKLRVKLNETSHKYFDHEDLDLKTLSTYPSDADIKLVNEIAAKEANGLFKLLGVDPNILAGTPNLLLNTNSWLQTSDRHVPSDSDLSDLDSDCNLSEDELVQHLLDTQF